MPAVSGPFCHIILACHFFFFVHLLPISLVDKPAGELIVTYMDLITLSTLFGGLAFSDPWLIVVVIFQSLTAPHMLRTNPWAPTKASAASGAHASIKAPRPGLSPPHAPPAASRPRGQLRAATAACKEPALPNGGRGGLGRRGRTLELHLGGLAGLSLPARRPQLRPRCSRVRWGDGSGPGGALGRMQARL